LSEDRSGILRDVTTVIANEQVTLLGVNSTSDTKLNTAKIELSLEVKNLSYLSKAISRLQLIRGVTDVFKVDK
jgi:GTP pyrophosphokinase